MSGENMRHTGSERTSMSPVDTSRRASNGGATTTSLPLRVCATKRNMPSLFFLSLRRCSLYVVSQIIQRIAVTPRFGSLLYYTPFSAILFHQNYQIFEKKSRAKNEQIKKKSPQTAI
jgi:hypothetical protein